MTMKEKISRFEKIGYKLVPKKFTNFVLLSKHDGDKVYWVEIFKHYDTYSWTNGKVIRNGNFRTGEVKVIKRLISMMAGGRRKASP